MIARPSGTVVIAVGLGLVVALAYASDLLLLNYFGTFVFVEYASGTAAGVGLILALRRPRHPLGWLFLGAGACSALADTSRAYSWHALVDLLINRTFVYGATSAAIAATFYLGIVALQGLLRPITSGSELPVAASTLVSFALFQPIRRRIQETVDRRFNRSRYDAARTVDEFAGRLRDEVDLDALKFELLIAVSRTMSPAHSSLWLRERAL